MSRIHFAFCVWMAVAAAWGPAVTGEAVEPRQLLGRWDLDVATADRTFPSWFEIRLSGNSTLVGSYVGQFGSARPVGKVELVDKGFRFSVPPQWEAREDDQIFVGRVEGDGLVGTTTDEHGTVLRWVARRAPRLDRERPVTWGPPIQLFNGKNLDGWKTTLDGVENGWDVRDGVLANVKPGNNLATEATFEDFQLVVEFRYSRGSNSGIYLRGRYEVQIEDNFGDDPDSHKIGGVYGFLTPSSNAALPAGQWQRYEITLIGRSVTVLLNGERVIDRQSIPGITGGALDSHEERPGPIYLQGDHGPVEFRTVELRPAKS